MFSSLSKRPNVPGLRSGFVAGDAAVLKKFLLYRTYHGGAMNPARVKDFYEQMVKAGLYKAGEVDLNKVATYQFVNKGVGLKKP